MTAPPPDVAAQIAESDDEPTPAPAASRNPSFASFKAGIESIEAG